MVSALRQTGCSKSAPTLCWDLNLVLRFACKTPLFVEPTSGLEPFPAPATSARSVVAERCTGLQILHRQRVLCSLPCLGLQGITCGLGSNKGQVVSEVRAVCSWIIRRRFLCKSRVAGARGSAEPMRRSSDGRHQPLCKPFHPIHQGGYPCRTNTCSVDFYA
jgi:hypothetical protein